jgi:hypothetical protein
MRHVCVACRGVMADTLARMRKANSEERIDHVLLEWWLDLSCWPRLRALRCTASCPSSAVRWVGERCSVGRSLQPETFSMEVCTAMMACWAEAQGQRPSMQQMTARVYESSIKGLTADVL